MCMRLKYNRLLCFRFISVVQAALFCASVTTGVIFFYIFKATVLTSV